MLTVFEPGLAIFLAAAGVAFFFFNRRSPLVAERAVLERMVMPCDDAVRARIAAATARRWQSERRNNGIGVAVTLLMLALCAGAFFRLVSMPLLFAGYFALLVISQAAQLLRVRARSGKRIARLAPRTIADIVPRWALVLPAIGWGASLYIGDRSGMWVPILISVGTSIAAVALAFAAISWPAIVGDDDIEADEAVDRYVRSAPRRGKRKALFVRSSLWG
ncbi:MAG TPA: hypothetical protein VMA98_13145 [Candidatus Acidoferrales bacterium]|nr:hypothetical protein [Candidatus Acidoferrales bacterium]